MKMLSALALTALLGTSAAFAATTPAATSTTTSGTAAPAASSSTAAPAQKHMSSKACNKQADEKKLTGDDRTKFVKDCHSGKSAK